MQTRKVDLDKAVALRIPNIATLYNLGTATIRAAIASGALPASKLNDYPRSPVVVVRAHVDAWLESRRVVPKGPKPTTPPAPTATKATPRTNTARAKPRATVKRKRG